MCNEVEEMNHIPNTLGEQTSEQKCAIVCCGHVKRIQDQCEDVLGRAVQAVGFTIPFG